MDSYLKFVMVFALAAVLSNANARPTRPFQGADPCGEPPSPNRTSLRQYLVIGDSISIGYTPHLVPHINTTFEVQHIHINGGNSDRGKTCLTHWLGENHWDFISYNFGLHDIAHDAEQLTLQQYTENMVNITERLNNTGAKLLWVDTTPVPNVAVSPERHDSDVKAFNAAVASILTKYEIPTDDLYGWVEKKCGDGYSSCPGIQLPKNVHYTPAGYDYLVESLLVSIHTIFPPPPPPPRH
eukprot:scpid74168/ scgid13611/ 